MKNPGPDILTGIGATERALPTELGAPAAINGNSTSLGKGRAVIYRVFITDGGYVVIDADSRKRRCSSCVMPDLSR